MAIIKNKSPALFRIPIIIAGIAMFKAKYEPIMVAAIVEPVQKLGKLRSIPPNPFVKISVNTEKIGVSEKMIPV